MPENQFDEAKTKKPHTPRQIVAFLFAFHRICADKNCRRAKRCSGDGAPCFEAFWWDRVTPCDKHGVRALFTALDNGSTLPQAIALSEAAMTRWDADHAPVPQAVDAPPQLQGEAPPRVAMPPPVRVRSL